jgi:predicted Zn-dependent peptidase
VRRPVLVPALVAVAAVAFGQGTPIPARPEALVFKPIAYEPPRAEDHRVVLASGMTVFIAEDKTLPLVEVSLLMHVGGYLDPPGKEGLAEFVGSQMRRGGTKDLSPDDLDARLDFMATRLGVSIGETMGYASLNCLKTNLDPSLKLLAAVLREPRFDEGRLALTKEAALQQMRKRNDDAAEIEEREWRVLLLGPHHFANRLKTQASLQAISRDDLLAFHRAHIHPATMVAAVSGDFERGAMLASLEAAFSPWPTPTPVVPPVPRTTEPAAPGLYKVEKDVNQGRVSLGLPTVERTSPDVYALEVMNEILGGSGFTARITKTVRSDEGLAYEAGSSIEFGIRYPGSFRAFFQSKSESVAYATSLVFREIERIRTSPVGESELDTIKRSLVETFPSRFANAGEGMGLFAEEEATGRSPEYLRTYRQKIQAVTAADVMRVARVHLDPEKMIGLVVGDLPAIERGDGRHPVDLVGLFKGRVVVVPLPDPLTLERPTSSSGKPRRNP